MLLDADRLYRPGWITLGADQTIRFAEACDLTAEERVDLYQTAQFHSILDAPSSLNGVNYWSPSVFLRDLLRTTDPLIILDDGSSLARAMSDVLKDEDGVIFMDIPDRAPDPNWLDANRDRLLLSDPAQAWACYHATLLLRNDARVALPGPCLTLADTMWSVGANARLHGDGINWCLIDRMEALSPYLLALDYPNFIPNLSLFLMRFLLSALGLPETASALRTAGIRGAGGAALTRLLSPLATNHQDTRPDCLSQISRLLTRGNHNVMLAKVETLA